MRVVSIEGETANVQPLVEGTRETFGVPRNTLKPQGRDDVLEAEDLVKRALKLSNSDNYSANWHDGDPNRSVWKAVLTHSGKSSFSATFPQWVIDDEELLLLAIPADGGIGELYSQLKDGLTGVQSDSSRVLARPVSDNVIIEMARRDLFVNLVRMLIPRNLEQPFERRLLDANPMTYSLCGKSTREEHAHDLIKRIPSWMYNKLRPHVPEPMRVDCDRRMCIKEPDMFKEYIPPDTKTCRDLTKHVLGLHDMSVNGWSSKALQAACIEIGEFHGEKAATFLRTELKRRNFKIHNYTEDTLAFLGANLPAEEARELAIEVEPVCRKRDRKEFEADWR